MSVADSLSLDPESVLRMPYRRFLAYQRLIHRRSVEEHNRRRREEYERGKET